MAHLPSPPLRPTYQPAQWPLAGPLGLPLSSLTDVRAPPSSSSHRQAGRAPLSSAPRPHLTGPPPVSYAMVRRWHAAPSPLTPPLLAASASPSSDNRCTPPSMALLSLHRRPVASLPSAPIKGALAAPHLAAPHTTILSSSLASELAPTVRLQPLPRRLVARPPHHRSPSGEALDGTPMLHFPSPTPWPSA
jgi:hypothetical protein